MLFGSMATIHAVVKLAVAPMIFATKMPFDTVYLNLFAFVIEAPDLDSVSLSPT